MKCGQRVTETAGAEVEKALWAENSNSESAKSFSEENCEKRAVVFKSDRFTVQVRRTNLRGQRSREESAAGWVGQHIRAQPLASVCDRPAALR